MLRLLQKQFFSGLIPFWIIGMIEFGIGLIVMRYVFDIAIQGSVFLLLVFTAVFLLGMLGLGFMVSIFSKNQVQATYVITFLFIIFILLSGLFTPIDSMPYWGQLINMINPIAHFTEILKYYFKRNYNSRFKILSYRFYYFCSYY